MVTLRLSAASFGGRGHRSRSSGSLARGLQRFAHAASGTADRTTNPTSSKEPLPGSRRRACHAVLGRSFGRRVRDPTGNVRTPKNKKGTLTESDNCGGASGIATVTQGSGDSWIVTAGAETGSCTATFDFTAGKHDKVVGWADLAYHELDLDSHSSSYTCHKSVMRAKPSKARIFEPEPASHLSFPSKEAGRATT